MTPFVSFLLGVLATWIGLVLAQRAKQRDKRSVISGRIYRTLEASERVARTNRIVGPLMKTFESVAISPGYSRLKPQQAYDAAVKEVANLLEFIRTGPKSSEFIAALRAQAAAVSQEERDRLKKLIGEYKAQIPTAVSFPSDEDLTYLEARISPFAFEYKQRFTSMLNSLELVAASDFASWPDQKISDWQVNFMEQLVLTTFLARLLRDATEKDAKRGFPWI